MPVDRLVAPLVQYRTIAASALAISGRYTGSDFSKAHGGRIDLSAIDAHGAGAGNAAFSCIAGAHTSVSGQLRVFQFGGNNVVEGDTDGVNGADFIL
ncbi:hypothetical protein AAFN86_10780 [Roseomonas sp. CAU 1739]|uniref:hypothetical protein n=1 Tax=Roseomonas sp. CAU 1739 TaxID=3140364 RepID=UPI00325B27F8